MYYQDAWRAARMANRPLANRIGLHYSLLSGAYALLQITVSMNTAGSYQASLVALLKAASPTGGIVPIEFLIPPLAVSVVSCLLGGIISLIVSYYAALNTARATRDTGLGQRAGLITSAMGSLTWLVLGILGALLTGTDGFSFTVDGFSNVSQASQLATIVLIVAVRAILLGAITLLFAFFFATLGAGVGKSRP